MNNVQHQSLILVSFLCLMVLSCAQDSYLPCGRQKVRTTFLVHKGSNALVGQWPWHVAIFTKNEYQCGGSIIDQNTILTAAHCVYTIGGVVPKQYVSVHVGRVHLNETNEHTKEHSVEEIIVHPWFRSSSVHYDIALIKLSLNITMTSHVQPVCLWTRDGEQNSIVGLNGTLIGFGYDERDVLSDHLQQAPIQVMDPVICIQMDRYALGPLMTPDVFCGIGKAGVNACNGDSGGGLFFEVKGKWFVRGLVSYTPLRGNLTWDLCDPLKPTVYTDVAKYLKWIQQYVEQSVLSYDSELFEIDYHEKLRIFNLKTCGVKSSTYTRNLAMWTLPWLGFVFNDNYNIDFCAVTLISNWYAVGPATCLENIEVNASVIFGGLSNDPHGKCYDRAGLTHCSHPTQTRLIKIVTEHPQFDNFDHDIALIELVTPVDTTQPNVNPICIPVTPPLRTNATTNLHVAVSLRHDSIKNIAVHYVESVECMTGDAQGKVTANLKNNQLCANNGNSGGDGFCLGSIPGSPLQEMRLINGTERYFLRGLDLLGFACQTQTPTVYLNAEPYLDWIIYHMKYHTIEPTNASGNATVNLSLESKWNMLQQQPGNEKLRLFNLNTCGITSAVIRPEDHVPWIGTLFGYVNSFPKKNMVVLINKWYALAPKGIVQTRVIASSWNYIILGKINGEKQGKPTYQDVEIKKIIIPPSGHPSQKFALIELLEPADLKNPYIKPICLPFMETLNHLNSTELVSMTMATDDRIEHSNKNLTLVNRSTCQDKLVWTNVFLLNENAACAIDPARWRRTYRTASFGSPFQVHVQFGVRLRYFLYGMNVNEIDQDSNKRKGVHLFDRIDLEDIEWILENMQEKEPQTTISNERINLQSAKISTSHSAFFNFKTCGVSSINYPTPWIGTFACRYDDLVIDGFQQVTLINHWYAVGSAILNRACSRNNAERIVVFGYPCFKEIAKERSTLKTNILESCGAPTQWIAIQKILVHPDYNKSAIYVNDIALIRLAAPANTSIPNVKPICLPIMDDIRNYDTSSLVMVYTDYRGKKYNINSVDNRYVNLTKCQKLWKHSKKNVTIDSSNHCVMHQQTSDDECVDPSSGISLHSRQMLGLSERYFLRGFALDETKVCSIYYPAVYSNTDAYLDWILTVMNQPENQPFDLEKELFFSRK